MAEKKQIFIGEDFLQKLVQFLAPSFSSCFILVDENTLKYCYPVIQNILPAHSLVQIQSGEANKTLETCSAIWTSLTSANADRKSLLINLGGGVIGDIGGFAAGCYKRGISFINIPTTLLSMVDASVGGKTGIDFMGFKNQIGLFHQPQAVFIHTAFLQTLPQRELLSGFAEVIKHCLISDRDAFGKIQAANPPLKAFNWDEMVSASVKIKSSIVEQDPHEKGVRKALNFGHTTGHAVESHFLKSDPCLLHGEAVAIGIISESYISNQKGLLADKELSSIVEVILHYFKLAPIKDDATTEILRWIKQDKKNVSDTTQFTLLQGIGYYSINNAVDEGLIIQSLGYYNSLFK